MEAGPTSAEAEAIAGLPGEEWRRVEEFDDYEVSDLGRVRSTKTTFPRIITANPNRDGYLKVRLYRGNRPYYRYVHALVAIAFIGPRADGLEVRHLDDNKLDNRAHNLTYGTRSDNMRDAVRNRTNHQSAKTHCPRNHPYDEANTIVNSKGWRKCRTCEAARWKPKAA
jgi:hypothetical protein